MITQMHNADYQVDELCEAFGVSRSGYYAHLRKPEGHRHREDQRLRPTDRRRLRGQPPDLRHPTPARPTRTATRPRHFPGAHRPTHA